MWFAQWLRVGRPTHASQQVLIVLFGEGQAARALVVHGWGSGAQGLQGEGRYGPEVGGKPLAGDNTGVWEDSQCRARRNHDILPEPVRANPRNVTGRGWGCFRGCGLGVGVSLGLGWGLGWGLGPVRCAAFPRHRAEGPLCTHCARFFRELHDLPTLNGQPREATAKHINF